MAIRAAYAIALVVLIGAIGAAVLRPDSAAPARAAASTAAERKPTSAASRAESATTPPETPVHAYLEREEFQRRTREFFAQSAALAPAQRTRDARAIEVALDRYERAGELSAGEAVLLRASLIRATVADEHEQTERIADLAARYQVNAEQTMAAWATRKDPQFDEYKTRERAIVEEVMALKSIPGNVSRDEYLRQRLQAERERVYADAGAR